MPYDKVPNYTGREYYQQGITRDYRLQILQTIFKRRYVHFVFDNIVSGRPEADICL